MYDEEYLRIGSDAEISADIYRSYREYAGPIKFVDSPFWSFDGYWQEIPRHEIEMDARGYDGRG